MLAHLPECWELYARFTADHSLKIIPYFSGRFIPSLNSIETSFALHLTNTIHPFDLNSLAITIETLERHSKYHLIFLYFFQSCTDSQWCEEPWISSCQPIAYCKPEYRNKGLCIVKAYFKSLWISYCVLGYRLRSDFVLRPWLGSYKMGITLLV